MKILIYKILIIAVLAASAGYSEDEESFKITIDRKAASNDCTMGYLIVDNNVIAYTLELPWLDNQNNVSCIPLGTYKGILRYDNREKWRIQLEDVPNRDNVQIHIGNYTTDTKGCILIGNSADVNNCSVHASTVAYEKFREAFYGSANPVSTPNKEILLTFK